MFRLWCCSNQRSKWALYIIGNKNQKFAFRKFCGALFCIQVFFFCLKRRAAASSLAALHQPYALERAHYNRDTNSSQVLLKIDI